MVILKSIIINLGLNPRSTSLSFFSEALIYNLQCSDQSRHNKGIGFTRGDIVSLIL